MTIIGIDGGLQGAMACLSTDNGTTAVYDTPVARVTVGTHKRHVYDVDGMWKWLAEMIAAYPWGIHVYIEKGQPMPKNGSQGNYSSGYCAGLWAMAMVASGLPHTLVHSQTWKRAMVRDLPKGKDSSVLRAKQLFPSIPLLLKKDHNKAEALLIAEYGRRTLNNKSTI